MQSKQTRCALIAARLHGTACAAVSYSTRSIFMKGAFISAILQTAPIVKGYPHLPVSFHRLLTAGLHLVLNTSCLRKKSCLVRYRMVECFHAITIDAEHAL